MNDDLIHSLSKNNKPLNYNPPFSSLSSFLSTQSDQYKNKEALVYVDGSDSPPTISYQQLEKLVANLAHLLQEKWGIKKGDSIAFSFENTPEIILLNYAAWSIGAKTVPLDVTRDTLDRKIYKVNLTDAKLFFYRSSPTTDEESAKIQASHQLTTVPVESWNSFKEICSEESSKTTQESGVDDDCLILFTSGTTADPKGARLTLRSLFANAKSIADWLAITEEDRFHIVLPLHHINSTTFTNTVLLSGGTIILSPHYSKSRFWQIMAENQATCSSIVPTIAYDLLSEEESFTKHKSELTNLKRMQLGSAPVQPTVVEEFIKKYGTLLVQGYGQTETSLRSAGIPYQELSDEEFRQLIDLNSVGAELNYTNVTVLDKEGNQVGESAEGEICVRGPIIMQGYLKNPTANAEAFAHDWFHSGDLGYWKNIFGRKFFFLKGRTKEIIKKGGVLISPLAIENALLKTYPELKKAYVIGFPDLRLGQEIGFITTATDSSLLEKITQDMKDQKIPTLKKYEMPRAMISIPDEDLPKTSTGKIQRVKIRELYEQRLLIQYRTITETPTHTFRLIGPEEDELLHQAFTINNDRWDKNLSATQAEFKERAENGILIAAINNKTQELLGSVSAIQMLSQDIKQIGEQNFWANTWDGITGKGTLSTDNHKGDTLMCVSISAKSTRPPKKSSPPSPKPLTKESLENYLQSDQDSVMRFHRRPKGDFDRGAVLTHTLPESRPEDESSLGYNVVLKYPDVTKQPSLSSDVSLGTNLIESALILAHNKDIKEVYVYSRPADLSKHLSRP